MEIATLAADFFFSQFWTHIFPFCFSKSSANPIAHRIAKTPLKSKAGKQKGDMNCFSGFVVGGFGVGVNFC